ncbi:MAG: sugar transferase [Lachnospiraceae bacterium]|jgi:exopolysaccharide biosynthesis polyprenyl glycosylphosphotransferase|nr:sugar transferase [Lachnospiraceae bacterium]
MKNYEPVKRVISFAFMLLAIAVLVVMFALVWYRYYALTIIYPFFRKGNWMVIAVYAFILYLGLYINEGNKIGFYTYGQTLFSQILGILVVNVLMYVQISLIGRQFLWVWPMVSITLIQMAFMTIWTWLGDKVYHKIYPPRRMVLVSGRGRHVNALMAKITAREDKYQVKEWIDEEEGIEKILPRLKHYDAVIICDLNIKIRNEITKYCFENDIRIYVSPRISDVIMRGADEIHLFDSPLLLCRNYGLTFEQRLVKRIMDIVIAGIGLLIASPFYLVIAIAIKAYDKGPVLYKQKRLTRGGRVFEIYKFRSMIVDAEKDGARLAGKEDDRITPVGKILRRFRLDELPQLLNILKGDMAVVGPRPERPELAEMISQDIPEFSYRLKVKAGLTGFAQVVGKYNTSPYDKLEMDLMYISKYSIRLDLKIMMMTPKMLFIKDRTEGVDE